MEELLARIAHQSLFNAVLEVWRVAWALPLAGFAAGLVDAIGGGGGLVTVPALLGAGVPPAFALGTNKSLAAPGSLVATARYARAGLLPSLARARWAALVALAGAAGAAGAAISQSAWLVANLRRVVPPLLVLVMAFLAKRWFVDEPRRRRALDAAARGSVAARVAASTSPPRDPLATAETSLAVAAIAGYDGLFGPGTGTLLLSFFEHRGTATVPANAAAKVFNLSSNVGALIYFAFAHRVIWPVGLAVAVAMMAGNYVGAGLVVRQGRTLVRVTVLATTTVMIAKLLWTA